MRHRRTHFCQRLTRQGCRALGWPAMWSGAVATLHAKTGAGSSRVLDKRLPGTCGG